jgi:hypothetical protein
MQQMLQMLHMQQMQMQRFLAPTQRDSSLGQEAPLPSQAEQSQPTW